MSKFAHSTSFLDRAEEVIPLGSQTFSKSKTQYPAGISPLFVDRARGPYVWDIDGNKYVDLVNSLAAITLGYNDRSVVRAVKHQLKKGTIFSLPSKIETSVAELLCELVPSAEMVRFGKNATDATSAAVRLARAATSRDHVLVCGYHGWQDWYIGATTRNKGVPQSVSELTHSFPYNDLSSLETLLNQYSGKVAAVIMEPLAGQYPQENYLQDVRRVTHKNGALLIFDETVTGFRVARGGAQELLGVTPDLSTFGKGMANGYPLSAVVGRRDIMMEMENIFFSGTFGGETLSLAAAQDVLTRLKKDDFTQDLGTIGESIASGVTALAEEKKINEIFSLSGHNSWKFINWTKTTDYSVNEIKTYFLQEAFENGLLVLGTHNVSLAMNSKIQRKIIIAYEKVFSKLQLSLEKGNLLEQLKAPVIESLFKLR